VYVLGDVYISIEKGHSCHGYCAENLKENDERKDRHFVFGEFQVKRKGSVERNTNLKETCRERHFIYIIHLEEISVKFSLKRRAARRLGNIICDCGI
jgi:hypothetical protein